MRCPAGACVCAPPQLWYPFRDASFGFSARHIGHPDKVPVITQACRMVSVTIDQERFTRTWHSCTEPVRSVGKVPVGELSLFRERKCLSLPAEYSTHVQKTQAGTPASGGNSSPWLEARGLLATEVERYLGMVGVELQKQGMTLEILLLGGAVMLIEVGNRGDTDDVDTYHLPDYVAVTKAAAVVAEREGLEDGWLNSAAAGFTYFLNYSSLQGEDVCSNLGIVRNIFGGDRMFLHKWDMARQMREGKYVPDEYKSSYSSSAS